MFQDKKKRQNRELEQKTPLESLPSKFQVTGFKLRNVASWNGKKRSERCIFFRVMMGVPQN